MDVTLRLEQIVLDIERTREPILIVGENLCNAVRTNGITLLMRYLTTTHYHKTQLIRVSTGCSTPILWACLAKKLRL